jgi:hypothetical protein
VSIAKQTGVVDFCSMQTVFFQLLMCWLKHNTYSIMYVHGLIVPSARLPCTVIVVLQFIPAKAEMQINIPWTAQQVIAGALQSFHACVTRSTPPWYAKVRPYALSCERGDVIGHWTIHSSSLRYQEI